MAGQRRSWLDGRVDVLPAALDEYGMDTSRASASELIQDRVERVAAQMGITPATARRYLTDEAVRDLARTVAVTVADEAPGADILASPRTAAVPVPVLGRCIAGLAPRHSAATIASGRRPWTSKPSGGRITGGSRLHHWLHRRARPRRSSVLIGQGHEVVLHARTQQRAAAVAGLAPRAAAVLVADLASAAQTQMLAGQVNDIGPMDAIIHNAGIYLEPTRAATTEGHARTSP